jgi:hypothetical protein
MLDPEIIRQIKSLPPGAELAPEQIVALDENIRLILEKTLPAKATSSRGGVGDVIALFKNDPRFRFLDQVPGAMEKIEQALRRYGGTL